MVIAALTGRRAPKIRRPPAAVMPVAIATEAFARLIGRVPVARVEEIPMSKQRRYFSSKKAKRELGDAPRPARLALEGAVCWLRANGCLRGRRTEARRRLLLRPLAGRWPRIRIARRRIRRSRVRVARRRIGWPGRIGCRRCGWRRWCRGRRWSRRRRWCRCRCRRLTATGGIITIARRIAGDRRGHLADPGPDRAAQRCEGSRDAGRQDRPGDGVFDRGQAEHAASAESGWLIVHVEFLSGTSMPCNPRSGRPSRALVRSGHPLGT